MRTNGSRLSRSETQGFCAWPSTSKSCTSRAPDLAGELVRVLLGEAAPVLGAVR